MAEISKKIVGYKIVEPRAESVEPRAESGISKRTYKLEGTTYKIRSPHYDHAFYVTINDMDGKPFEIFINSKNMEGFPWVTGLTRVMSAIFRQRVDLGFLIEELSLIYDPRGGYWVPPKEKGKKGEFMSSIISEIANCLRDHLGMIQTPSSSHPTCPKCGGEAIMQEGCLTCKSCEYSKCG